MTNNENKFDDQIMTVKEASKLLQCNTNYVYKLIKAGILPAIELGRVKILKSDLYEMLRKYKGCDLSDPENIICKFNN